MDRITKNLLKSFSEKFQIGDLDEATRFELFCGYSMICKHTEQTFELLDIHCGGEDDNGIDAFGLIVEGDLITNSEDLKELIDTRTELHNVKFVFVQAKRSERFETSDFRTFCDGVESIFTDGSEFDSEKMNDIVKMVAMLVEASAKLKKGMSCYMYYVCTGGAERQKPILNAVDKGKKDIAKLGLCENIQIELMGALDIHNSYREIAEANKCSLKIQKIIALPSAPPVNQAYLGYISGKEFIKLISDKTGNEIIKSVFYSNVRDFQGENRVNKEIAASAISDPNEFILYNNGVTIICKELNNMGEKFDLSGYQVVNGCQTSHVLFSNKDEISDSLLISIKLIETNDDETICNVIKATNRQTVIADEQFVSLNDFTKHLEDFYNTFDGEGRLYYERRAMQFRFNDNVEKVRIVSTPMQIKAMASMFYKLPHRASAYYGTLLRMLDNKFDLFEESHTFLPYYLSAYILYKLEFAFRNNKFERKYRKFRYHLLMMFRFVHITASGLKGRKLTKECTDLLTLVDNNALFREECKRYFKMIDEEISKLQNSESVSMIKSKPLVDQLAQRCLSFRAKRKAAQR